MMNKQLKKKSPEKAVNAQEEDAKETVEMEFIGEGLTTSDRKGTTEQFIGSPEKSSSHRASYLQYSQGKNPDKLDKDQAKKARMNRFGSQLLSTSMEL